MALPVNHPLTDRIVPAGVLADVSTSSSAYAPIPIKGVIQDVWVTISAAITSANAEITVKRNATTIGTITLAYDGSAPGSTFKMDVTGSEADRTATAGDFFHIATDGASSTTAIGNFVAVIRGA
jgi:hypothetical protein